MPWPTSGFFATSVIAPSGVILMNALGAKPVAGACAKRSATGSSWVARSKPPPASAETRKNDRRVTVVGAIAYSSPRGPTAPACVVVVAPIAAARCTA
jgi:hypothetical protein